MGVVVVAVGVSMDGLLMNLEDLGYSSGISSSLPVAGSGSLPVSWKGLAGDQFILLIVSIACAPECEMVRAWSAIGRVMAWRIHQVA